MNTSLNTTRFHHFAIATALAASLAAVLPAQAQDSQASSSDDIALASKVKAALLEAAPFQDHDVDLSVTASNGPGDLSGWVTYANDPQTAARIAASVQGVRSVTTHLHNWSSDNDSRV